MKASRIFVTIAIVVGIVAAAWAWHTIVSRKSNLESQQNGSVGDETKTQVTAVKPETQKPKIEEKRFSIVLRLSTGGDTQGSITLKEAENGLTLISTERPGDAMMMSIGIGGGGGGMQPIIGTAEGSEIRFLGTLETTNGRVKGEQGGRLAFRKADGDWAYVSGLGQYEEEGNTTKLGHDRTVASCLDLLNNEDPILREGGARDLGRLCKPDDAARVIPQLVAMLKDPSVPIRRGAIEGLGLIGTAEAATALQSAMTEETDQTTKEFYEEALGFCAAYTILGEPASASEPSKVGLDRLLGKPDKKTKKSSNSKKKLSDWETENLIRRVADHKEEALASLDKAATSTNSQISQAALKIKTAFKQVEKGKP